MKSFLFLALVFFSACSTKTYYIVRHAEKASGAGDVPLSAAGQQRAQSLANRLNGKVDFVSTTATNRTRQTAQPLSERSGIKMEVYDHRDTALLSRYRASTQKNLLLVGHSNTVDDLVNFYMGKPTLTDLPDTAYGDLFIVEQRGKNTQLKREKF